MSAVAFPLSGSSSVVSSHDVIMHSDAARGDQVATHRCPQTGALADSRSTCASCDVQTV